MNLIAEIIVSLIVTLIVMGIIACLKDLEVLS